MGDVIDLSLWSDGAGVFYDYTALAILASRPNAAIDGDLLLNVAYTGVATRPLLTLGDPVVFDDVLGAQIDSGLSFNRYLTSNLTIEALVYSSAYTCLYGLHYGDLSPGSQFIGDDTRRPIAYGNACPTEVSYYPTSIRVTRSSQLRCGPGSGWPCRSRARPE
jgi:hypothetical protein